MPIPSRYPGFSATTGPGLRHYTTTSVLLFFFGVSFVALHPLPHRMTSSETGNSQRRLTPGAAILAWLWPGLGHISLGHRRRGLLIMLGVLFLFVSGLLVGGVDCVDRRNDRLWFLAQSLCGPISFVADAVNQRLVQSNPGNVQWRSLAHVNEMGTLFIALAGLMNLVVILDALYFEPKPLGGEAARRTEDRA